MRHFTNDRTGQRVKERFQAVQKLKAAGWVQTISDLWKDPKGRFAYPTKQAIERMNQIQFGNIKQ